MYGSIIYDGIELTFDVYEVEEKLVGQRVPRNSEATMQFPDQEGPRGGHLPSVHWQYPPAPPFVVQDCLNILEGAREEGKEGRIRGKNNNNNNKVPGCTIEPREYGVYFGVLRECRQVRWKIILT